MYYNFTRKGNKRNVSRRNRTDSETYVIYTDGERTESLYFKGLRDSLSVEDDEKVVIRINKVKRTENLIESCSEEMSFDVVHGKYWIVFDRDEVANFDEIVAQAERRGINVGWSNPCFELWLAAYLGPLPSGWDTSVICCRKFSELFERVTGQEYSKSNPKNYELLLRCGDEARAIESAERRLKELQERYLKPSQMHSCTTVHKLVVEIRKGAATA